MHPRFLPYYEAELRFIRELGDELSRRFPKVAARLGLSGLSCDDPHVERLLQGFAFTASRAHMALDAEFPAFTQALAEVLHRHLLAPTPSMAVAQFVIAPQSSALGDGFVVPRGTVVDARADWQAGESARCEFRTAHPVKLLPIAIESVTYTSVLHDLAGLRVPSSEPIRALLKLRLRCHNMGFDRLGLQTLPLFLHGRDEHSSRLYEHLISCASAVVMRWGPSAKREVTLASVPRPVQAYGFEPEQALLPAALPPFEPYRLLQEYFACPARFDFVELTGLASGLARCARDEVELIVALKRFEPALEHAVDASRFVLFATPVVNLFPHDCGRATLAAGTELQLVPDPTRPRDLEVHSVTRVSAHSKYRAAGVELQPVHLVQPEHDGACHPRFVLRRQASPLPQRLNGARSGYIGSDVFLSLVDPSGTGAGTQQVEVHTLCTNRDLPMSLWLGRSRSRSHGAGADFDTRSGVPADSVRCLVAPTAPTPAQADGPTAWRFLSHLSVNYLSLHEQTGGVAALRELLELYAALGASHLRHQIDGIHTLESRPVIGPFPDKGPHTFVRGLSVRLECEERAFGRHGAFTLASVLARLFAKHASTRSFVQTELATRERGEIYTFPALPGLRHVL